MRDSLLLCLLTSSVISTLADVTTMTDKILKDILKDYNPKARPAGNLSDRGVALGINIVPLHLNVDPELGTLSSHVWFVMRWRDTRLKWAASNYENISRVHVGPERLWRPDIMVYNSVEHFDYETTDLLLTSDGTIWWVPPVNLHTSCDLDWTYWPWDRQVCHLVVGSWTKTGWELDVQNLNRKNISVVDKANFAPSAWNLVKGHQVRRVYDSYDDTPDFYIDIDVSLVMDRRSTLDKKVAVLPLLCAASLLLATFWTHPADTARLKLNSAVCTILVVTLLALRFMLPSAGGALPLVITFNTGLVVLAVLQLILALSLSNLVMRTDTPPLVLASVVRTLAPLLCLSSDIPLIGQVPSHVIPPWADPSPDPETAVTMSPASSKIISGWNLLAQVVDRLTFILFLFIILIFMGTYIGKSTANMS